MIELKKELILDNVVRVYEISKTPDDKATFI